MSSKSKPNLDVISLPPGRRAVISVLLILHLAAVFLPPFTFATSAGPGMASPFARPLMDWFRPYIDAAFLNHGYFFFAPNPGPSHLVRFEVEYEAGRPSQQFLMPDRHRYWPRLFYHRHFMLAETLNNVFAPANVPPEVLADPAARDQWQRSRAFYELVRDSYQNKIRVELQAARVTAVRIEHRQPSPEEWLRRRLPLNTPELYLEMPDGMPEPGSLPPGEMLPRGEQPFPIQDPGQPPLMQQFGTDTPDPELLESAPAREPGGAR